MKDRIWIIEDDVMIANLLKSYLGQYEFDVVICENFENIEADIMTINPRLVLLDINLPVFNGFYWCKKIRAVSMCPIIFISAQDSASDQVLAIERGADDYITKPFSIDVVIAKVRSQLRRVYGEYATTESKIIKCTDCILDINNMKLMKDNTQLCLTGNEMKLFRAFFNNYPAPLSRDALLEELWDDDAFVEENTLNVNISRVRKKLDEIGSKMTLKAIRSVGYRLLEKTSEDEDEEWI